MKFTDGTPDTIAMITAPMQTVVTDQHAGVIFVVLIVAKRLCNRIPIDIARIEIRIGRFPNPSSKCFDTTRPKIASYYIIDFN